MNILFGLRQLDLSIKQVEERLAHHGRDTFVAVKKGMVLRESECVGCGQVVKVWVGLGPQLFRAS